MFKLMKLELSKNKMSDNLKNVLIVNICIIGLLLLIIYSGLNGNETKKIKSYEEAFVLIDIFSKSIYIVFAATLLARYVIDEYKNKTISVLFMYPVKRKKIIAAKLLIIAIFTILAIMFTDILASSVFLIVNSMFHIVSGALTGADAMEYILSFFVNAMSSTCISFIPLCFGMIKKSIPTTIISSVLVVLVAFSGDGRYLFGFISIVPLAFAVIGVIAAYLSIKNIDNADVANKY